MSFQLMTKGTVYLVWADRTKEAVQFLNKAQSVIWDFYMAKGKSNHLKQKETAYLICLEYMHLTRYKHQPLLRKTWENNYLLFL